MTVEATPSKRFISPYDDDAPPGAEGWQDLYPYYLVFREDRRDIEEAKFWFADSPTGPGSSSPSTRSSSSSRAAAWASTTPATT